MDTPDEVGTVLAKREVEKIKSNSSSASVAGPPESSLCVPNNPEKEEVATSEASVFSSIARERRVLDISPKEVLQINSVKMKSKGQRCLHIEEPEIF